MPPREADAGAAGARERGADEVAADAEVRVALVAAGRRLRAAGLVAATEGNLSVRLDASTLLITPSGRRKDEVLTDELLVVPLVVPAAGDGPSPATAPRPSSDVAIHRALYAARPDVTAVAHAHLPASMGLTLASEIPDPAALPETALFLGKLPFLPFGQPGSDELAGRVAAAFGEGGERGEGGEGRERMPVAVLLERHGAVAAGTGDPVAAIGAAVDRLELVEVLCRTWRDALLLRAARAAIGPPSEP